MAATYTLISSNVLSSSAASVTFSSIPATYTDLVVRCSVRGDVAANNDTVAIRINGVASGTYSNTRLQGAGSGTPSSGRSTNTSTFQQTVSANGASSTSDTFSSLEIYLPSYTDSNNKVASGFGVAENNATAATISSTANLFRNSSVISSIAFLPNNSTNWVAGSSFYLYGIKNS